MRPAAIPELSLPELAQRNVLQRPDALAYSLATISPSAALLHVPFRLGSYCISLCRQGSTELRTNLTQYRVQPDSLLVLAPEVVRTWQRQSADYEAVALFFTEAFFLQGSATATLLRDALFLRAGAPPVLPLLAAEATAIGQLLEAVRQLLAGSSAHKAAMVCHYAHILVHLVADCYERYLATHVREPSPELVERFKQLVREHYLQRRLVHEYADLLCVTAKHLGEMVKAATGRPASAWIADLVVLESCLQLHQTTRSLGQVAEALHFSDASAFGKFFRRHTGLTPDTYRRQGPYRQLSEVP
jgi:AraC family transcriptional activator of pobA